MTLLLKAEVVRILLTIGVFLLPLNLHYKIIVGWVLDRLDCMSDMWPYKGPLFSSDTSACKTVEYSKYDKVGDMVLNTLILYTASVYYPKYMPLLVSLYTLRLIGVIRFFKTEKKREFIYFPNLFITTSLVLSLVGRMTPEMFLMVCIYQFGQEVFMHGK